MCSRRRERLRAEDMSRGGRRFFLRPPSFRPQVRSHARNTEAFHHHFKDSGVIDWEKAGHYSMQVETKANGLVVITFTWKKPGKTAQLDKSVLNEDAGPFELKRSWSIDAAFIASEHDEYCCKHFFPGSHRKLSQADSADMRVVAMCGGGDGSGMMRMGSRAALHRTGTSLAIGDPPRWIDWPAALRPRRSPRGTTFGAHLFTSFPPKRLCGSV